MDEFMQPLQFQSPAVCVVAKNRIDLQITIQGWAWIYGIVFKTPLEGLTLFFQKYMFC